MNVLRLHGTSDLRLHDEPIPDPAAGESLVRVTAVGICGSDLHWYVESGIGDARLEHPLVLGHELAGVVESGYLAGRQVAIDPSISCGSCEFCQEGNPNLCLTLRFAGHSQQDGGMQEYIAWPTDHLFPLPEEMSTAAGAMLEPLGVAIHAVDLGHLRPGMDVGVFGSGPIGLLVAQVARLAGASRIFMTDLLPHRLEAAQASGAEAFPVEEGNEANRILAATGGRGVDVAFEAAGVNTAVEAAIEAVKPGGRVVLAGIPEDDRSSFSASTARRKGLTLLLVRRMKHTYPRAIRMVASGKVEVSSLVTHCYPLEQYREAFDVAARRDGLKVILQPSPE